VTDESTLPAYVRIPRAAMRRAAAFVNRRETYVWLELDLRGERPSRSLPEGVTLRHGTPADEPALAAMDAPGPELIAERLPEGVLWIAEEPGTALFSCWIFRRRAPMFGWTDLPPDAVCLEHSATAAAARGRGVAPGAWATIADGLAAEGVPAMITKVRDTNEPSLRAVGKAGFREVCRMHVIQHGPWERVRFEPPGAARSLQLSAAVDRARKG
jgi:hypothetical protein